MSAVKKDRIAELDVLRGFAAVAVMLFHYTVRWAELPGKSVSPFGEYAVHLFFMISGFVIFMTLDNTETARDFVVSRFSRLFPTFWASVLLTYGVVMVFGLPGKAVTLNDLVLNFTMIPGLLKAEPVDGTYWTLEIELIFYGLMLMLFMANGLRKIHWVLGVWLVVRLIEHAIVSNGMHVSYTAGHLLLLPRIALFGAGMMLYCLYRGSDLRSESYWLLAACILVIAIVDGPAALPIPLAGSIMIMAISHRELAIFRNPVILFFGTISYPLYLLHENIGFVILRGCYRWGMHSNIAIVLAFLAVVALSSAVTFWVERPAMQAIRQWYKRRSTPPANQRK